MILCKSIVINNPINLLIQLVNRIQPIITKAELSHDLYSIGSKALKIYGHVTVLITICTTLSDGFH